MHPSFRTYCQFQSSPSAKTIFCIVGIILPLLGLHFMGVFGDKEKEISDELRKLEPKFQSTKSLVYAYESGAIDEKIEKRRSGMEYMIGRRQEEIEEIKELYRTGQLSIQIARMRIERNEREIAEYREQFQKYVDAREYMEPGKFADLKQKKSELKKKVEKMKWQTDPEEIGSVAGWGRMSFWAFFFGCMILYCYMPDAWMVFPIIFVEMLLV